MAFADVQIRRLKAPIQKRHIKEREVDGKTLHYLEGWHVIAEANRIFGFDGWDRETVASTCVWQKHVDYRFTAAYLTRVRISVRTAGAIITREGLGSGEASAATAGQAHERASKAAETDATKRALCTFGNSFGLSLYRDKNEPPRLRIAARSANVDARTKSAAVDLNPAHERPTGHIDKSALVLGEPTRQRDRDHLRFVASQPCLVCGASPSQAHHVRLAQPRALGRKVSDEYTVPLCADHHRELHMRGDEGAWWHDKGLKPLKVAEELWRGASSQLADRSPPFTSVT